MFYEQFNNLCRNNSTTPTEFTTKILKLSSSKVTAWKNGSIPKYGILETIANYFGVTVGYLFDGNTQSSAVIQTEDSGVNKLIEEYTKLNEQAQKELLNYAQYMTSKPENIKQDENKRAV